MNRDATVKAINLLNELKCLNPPPNEGTRMMLGIIISLQEVNLSLQNVLMEFEKCSSMGLNFDTNYMGRLNNGG